MRGSLLISAWLCLPLMTANGLADEVVLVTRIVDGDTFDVVDGRRMRMEGVDAPELDQPYGKQARKWLGLLIGDRQVQVSSAKPAAYSRYQVRVVFENVDINGIMVLGGHAWCDQRYSHDPRWVQYQRTAMRRGVGIWSGTGPVAPWEWRSSHERVSSPVGRGVAIPHLLSDAGGDVRMGDYGGRAASYRVVPERSRVVGVVPFGTWCPGGT